MRFVMLFFISLMASCGMSYGDSSFMPENNLNLQDSITNSNINQQVFEEQMQKVRDIYGPIFRSVGLTMDLRGDWNDSTVNAYASRSGSTARIRMFGGLARRAEITPDGFIIVICHEVGHHLGGYPYIQDWASAEGQSDLFATLSCAKKVFAKYPDVSELDESNQYDLTEKVINYKKWCGMIFTDESQIAVCARSLIGAKSTADLLAQLGGGSVNYATPDQTKVSRTNTSYPRTTQCRLDTYAYGALCAKTWNDGIIPRNEQQGGSSICYRPRCWFKPGI